MSGHMRQQLARGGIEPRLALHGQVAQRPRGRACLSGLASAACARSRAAAASRAPARPARGRAACSRARCRRCRPGSARAPAARWAPGACCGAWPPRQPAFGFSGRPSAASRGSSAWYSAVTPSSLKRLAMVPNTGICSGGVRPGFAVALHLLGHVAQRVGAPLRSNLLMATNSAKSSMSIFSSWLAAPNSGVITYIGTSTSGTMAASPWPMPEVSTTMRSKPAALQAAARRAGPG
jgi:hypothetical protein